MSAPILPTRNLTYGGDWNPDQWPKETVAEDIELEGSRREPGFAGYFHG